MPPVERQTIRRQPRNAFGRLPRGVRDVAAPGQIERRGTHLVIVQRHHAAHVALHIGRR